MTLVRFAYVSTRALRVLCTTWKNNKRLCRVNFSVCILMHSKTACKHLRKRSRISGLFTN